jgi:hypothetical protein
MRSWRLIAMTAVLWVSLASLGWYLADHWRRDSIFAGVAIALVLGGMVTQRLVAPFLIRLGPAKVGERLNIVGRSEGGTS